MSFNFSSIPLECSFSFGEIFKWTQGLVHSMNIQLLPVQIYCCRKTEWRTADDAAQSTWGYIAVTNQNGAMIITVGLVQIIFSRQYDALFTPLLWKVSWLLVQFASFGFAPFCKFCPQRSLFTFSALVVYIITLFYVVQIWMSIFSLLYPPKIVAERHTFGVL